jgi:hypothetical protein
LSFYEEWGFFYPLKERTMSKPIVRKCHKSSSWLIEFSYRDAHGVPRRFRRSAGKGVTKEEAQRKARALYREYECDPVRATQTFLLRPNSDARGMTPTSH